MRRLEDWLEISTEGFAQRQLDRPPAHLVKELVQNALDATEGVPDGRVDVVLAVEKVGRRRLSRVTVTDNGPGISDPRDLRTVFCSGKEDSFLLRGRLGQGFKEVLCLARYADVLSRGTRIHFHLEGGARVTDITEVADAPERGTRVSMGLPWPSDEVPDIVEYLKALLVPKGRTVTVNGWRLPWRPPAQTLAATLRTEVFEDGRWTRRQREGAVDLVGVAAGEVPTIYEMGIPVCPVDWPQPYHVDVHMRVPMNPRRDAVAAGYHKELYAQVLPKMLASLKAEDLRNEWVSEAVEKLPAEVQQDVVSRAFGDSAVRSVPTMGKYDWDSDARELGFEPINTRLLPKGLRSAAEAHLKSSRDVEFERRGAVAEAESKQHRVDPKEARAVAAYRWLASRLLGGMAVEVTVVAELVVHGATAAAAWAPGGHLMLNAQARGEWVNPFEPRALGILVHEAAHELAPHHGDDFRRAVENVAGRLARLCLGDGETIKTMFSDLLKETL